MTARSVLAVPPSAVRVFVGFRHPDLEVGRFLQDLGQTFMPGTPYMLAPLGLAAYLPSVIEERAGRRLPQEMALIAWTSQEAQRRATRETLRGRVYTQSHGGVYAPGSTATFPLPIEKFNTALPGSFYLYPDHTDWQSGAYRLVAGTANSPTVNPQDFRAAVVNDFLDDRKRMRGGGIDQCMVVVGDAYAVCWQHSETAEDLAAVPLPMLDTSANVDVVLEGLNIVCRAEPPTVPLATSMALNFVFSREPSSLLRP